MKACFRCAQLRFVWGWGHGPAPRCEAHWFWRLAARRFEKVVFERMRAAERAAAEMKIASRARRLERRRQRRAEAAAFIRAYQCHGYAVPSGHKCPECKAQAPL